MERYIGRKTRLVLKLRRGKTLNILLKGFCINTIKRQYLTSEANQLFHLISRISIDCDVYKNKIPTNNDEDSFVAGRGFEPLAFGL